MYFIFIHDNYFCHTSSQFQNETPGWRILANSAAASCQQQCRGSWRGWQLCSGLQLPSQCGAGPSARGFVDKEGASCSSYFRPGGRLCVIKQKLFVMVLLLKVVKRVKKWIQLLSFKMFSQFGSILLISSWGGEKKKRRNRRTKRTNAIAYLKLKRAWNALIWFSGVKIWVGHSQHKAFAAMKREDSIIPAPHRHNDAGNGPTTDEST